MTGRIGGRASGGSHSAADQEPAASTTAAAGCRSPDRGLDPRQTVAVEHGAGDLSDHQPAALGLEGGGERRRQRPRIDGGLVRRVHAAVAAGAEPGLELATGARRQPFGLETVRAA